jgi:hypothetical protein
MKKITLLVLWQPQDWHKLKRKQVFQQWNETNKIRHDVTVIAQQKVTSLLTSSLFSYNRWELIDGTLLDQKSSPPSQSDLLTIKICA